MRWALLVSSLLAVGCGGTTSAADFGEELFQDSRLSDSQFNSFITVTGEQAIQQAAAADARLAQGNAPALCGVPIAHKDIFCTNGVRTIINDYAERDSTRFWLKGVLYAATFVIVILGTLVIFTFDPCPVVDGVQLPGGFCPAP